MKGKKNVDIKTNSFFYPSKTDGWEKVKGAGLKTKCVVPRETEMLFYRLIQALENNPQLNQINSDCSSRD